MVRVTSVTESQHRRSAWTICPLSRNAPQDPNWIDDLSETLSEGSRHADLCSRPHEDLLSQSEKITLARASLFETCLWEYFLGICFSSDEAQDDGSLWERRLNIFEAQARVWLCWTCQEDLQLD
jgi:hypothetical protein